MTLPVCRTSKKSCRRCQMGRRAAPRERKKCVTGDTHWQCSPAKWCQDSFAQVNCGFVGSQTEGRPIPCASVAEWDKACFYWFIPESGERPGRSAPSPRSGGTPSSPNIPPLQPASTQVKGFGSETAHVPTACPLPTNALTRLGSYGSTESRPAGGGWKGHRKLVTGAEGLRLCGGRPAFLVHSGNP